MSDALARAGAGQRIDKLLEEIAVLQQSIDNSPAETLQDAAVKLRRLGAYVDKGQPAVAVIREGQPCTGPRRSGLDRRRGGNSPPRYARKS